MKSDQWFIRSLSRTFHLSSRQGTSMLSSLQRGRCCVYITGSICNFSIHHHPSLVIMRLKSCLTLLFEVITAKCTVISVVVVVSCVELSCVCNVLNQCECDSEVSTHTHRVSLQTSTWGRCYGANGDPTGFSYTLTHRHTLRNVCYSVMWVCGYSWVHVMMWCASLRERKQSHRV